MVEVTFGALSQAFELLHTPRALEMLGDLATGKSPYDRGDDDAVVSRAIDCLRSVGAVTSSPKPSQRVAGTVEITPQGRGLFERLVEVDRMAAAQHQLGAGQPAAQLIG